MLKRYLITKLIAVNLLVAGFTVAVVWISIDTLAAGYFVTLMEKYHISPEPAHAMFVDSVHRYLAGSLAGAVGLAIALSWVLNRRILKPLTRMNAVTHKIAAGEFAARVPVATADEVGQLARAFNGMATNLEKIERLRRSLMIDVAHELRTPLTNMRGYLEALNDKILPPSPQTLALLQAETLRLVQLVEDVLALARADAAPDQLRLASCDLKSLLEKTISPFSAGMKAKSLGVQIDADPDNLLLTVDPQRLARILRNLMANAVQYAPPGTKVNIAIATDENTVRVDFANLAADLSADDLPYLFERFYRGERSRSRNHGGAGIGLAIVKELVVAHGGSVYAKRIDERLHIGFTLPRHQHWLGHTDTHKRPSNKPNTRRPSFDPPVR